MPDKIIDSEEEQKAANLEIVEKVKGFRKEILSYSKAIEFINFNATSPAHYSGISPSQLVNALTSYKESYMWLGRVLKMLNTENPYPESRNPENTKIEPHADMPEEMKNLPFTIKFDEGSVDYRKAKLECHVQNVKWLRKNLNDIEERITGTMKDIEAGSPPFTDDFNGIQCAFYFFNSLNAIALCQMWLGQELGRMKEEDSITNFWLGKDNSL